MSIGNNGGFFENIAHDEVRGLPAHTGQRGQLFNAVRNLSAEVGFNLLRHTDDIAGFRPVKAAGMNERFNVLNVGIAEGVKVGVFFKKSRCNKVDPCVRTLRGKARCN